MTMSKRRLKGSQFFLFILFLGLHANAMAQDTGSIRGMAYDADFDVPLPLVDVVIAQTGQETQATEQGNYLFTDVKPGTYTLIFSKQGYERKPEINVVVSAGQITERDVRLGGELVEMEEFIVSDVQIGGGTEIGLLNLRFDASALMDSVGAELMSQAGASDAGDALRLVAGATVEDGKFAVVRGLPDRYVVAQLSGVRLPTADAEKRAVELDQFPSAAISSIQVTKTFIPDQQGDASGGAVNVVLRGIPAESFVKFDIGYSYNTNVANRDDFLTYDGGGVSTWGFDDGQRDPQIDNLGSSWDGAVGVSRGKAPVDFNWGVSFGERYEFDTGLTVGAFGSFFYKRDSSFYDDGINDSYWIRNGPGNPMTPVVDQGTPPDDFQTALFDVTEASEEVTWGGLGAIGLETDSHALTLSYLYTRSATDTATLAEDTRGKEFFFPGYDPDDTSTPGHDEPFGAPYLRLETLAYKERTTETIQLNGQHTLTVPDIDLGDQFIMLAPRIDWYISASEATLNEPDKRQFGSLWIARRQIGPFVIPAQHLPFKPAANFTVGNLQRTFKKISEDSDQIAVNLTIPFEQWSSDEGFLKFGVFNDQVFRSYEQASFGNFSETSVSFQGDYDDFWSQVWPDEVHNITLGQGVDANYQGSQNIQAAYGMFQLPLSSRVSIMAGARYETTDISTIVQPADSTVTWIPPNGPQTILNPGDADVQFSQEDILPAVGLNIELTDKLSFRAAFSQTVARQTFRELTPIQQQEFLGGDVFVGNPELQMSALTNYDLRLDYVPYEGGLISASWFYKDITDPIEYVQRSELFTFITPVNFPEGTLTGVELEARQRLGEWWEPLEGLSLGANATFMQSEVTLPTARPQDIGSVLADIGWPTQSRDMLGTPEYLLNVNLTYDIEATGTRLGLFYTVNGDTLIAGAGQKLGALIPDVYATEVATLNFSLIQEIGRYIQLKLQAKNLLDPEIQTVFRAPEGPDVLKTSFTKGIDLSVSLSANIPF